MPNYEQSELTPEERERIGEEHNREWRRVEQAAEIEAFHATEEQKDEAWRSFLELLIEAAENKIKNDRLK